jgi:hypothetical protein
VLPVVVLACCFFLLLLVPVILFLFTYIFRQACALCGLPKPTVLTAFGVMLLIRISTFVSEAVMEVIVAESCRAAGLPRWETGIIVIFLFLPIDLLISAGLHAALMNIKFGKGIEVWFVQWLIILSIVIGVVFVAALVYLALG